MTTIRETAPARRRASSLEDVASVSIPRSDAAGWRRIADAAPFAVKDAVLLAGGDRLPESMAHRSTRLMLVALHGQFTVRADDGDRTADYQLVDASQALFVPADIWHSLTASQSDGSLLVLSDRALDGRDEIRDRSIFESYLRHKREVLLRRPTRLNLGCGGRPMADYINVDMDSLEEIRTRYPNQTYDDDLVVVDYDLFALPFDDDSVAEIRAEGLVEHLPFIDEPRFFREVTRVLEPGGLLYIATVDFEQAAREWLAADDDWKDFFRDDDEAIMNQHWFGTYSYQSNNRWGYMTATFYGSQKGAGQFHTNAYSEGKFRAICARMNLEVEAIDRFRWKGDRDPIIALSARKPRV